MADRTERLTPFCGGSRDVMPFVDLVDLVDDVFVLQVDLDTLDRRLVERPADELGARPAEPDLTRS